MDGLLQKELDESNNLLKKLPLKLVKIDASYNINITDEDEEVEGKPYTTGSIPVTEPDDIYAIDQINKLLNLIDSHKKKNSLSRDDIANISIDSIIAYADRCIQNGK